MLGFNPMCDGILSSVCWILIQCVLGFYPECAELLSSVWLGFLSIMCTRNKNCYTYIQYIQQIQEHVLHSRDAEASPPPQKKNHK